MRGALSVAGASSGWTDRRTSFSSGCAPSAPFTGPIESASSPRRPATGRSRPPRTSTTDTHTYSSEAGGVTAANVIFPLEMTRAMFIGMDPPKHDRLKALFQAGFTPKRIADHEDAIRAIVTRTLDRLEDRDTCDLVTDVAQPVVSRVIGSFMGSTPGDD